MCTPVKTTTGTQTPVFYPLLVAPTFKEAPGPVTERRRAPSVGSATRGTLASQVSNYSNTSTVLSVSPAPANQASNSSNSSNSSTTVLQPSVSENHIALRGRKKSTKRPASARHTRTPDSRALIAAASLFLLTRDSLTQGRMRAADVSSLARQLSPRPRAADKVQAQAEYDSRLGFLSTLVDLVRDTATGSKLMQCVYLIAATSRDGDGHYLRDTASGRSGSSRHERQSSKDAAQSRQLSKAAWRMVEEVHRQFMVDALTSPLLEVLQTCDRLVVNWYDASRAQSQRARQKPDLAFIHLARQNMLVTALFTRGLSKLHLDQAHLKTDISHALDNINHFVAATMRTLQTSPRVNLLLQQSTQKMSRQLAMLVAEGRSRYQRFAALETELNEQGLNPDQCKAAWNWLTHLESVLNMPDILQPYFEQAAVRHGAQDLTTGFKGINSLRVTEWALFAQKAFKADLEAQNIKILKLQLGMERNALSGLIRPDRKQIDQLKELTSKLFEMTDHDLRLAMAEFEK